MMTFLPIIVAIVLIIVTRRTMLALLIGAGLGAVIFSYKADGNIFTYITEVFWNALSNSWHYSALLFTVLLGGFAVLLQAGGGLSKLFQKVKSPRQLEARVMGLGFLCFFDGLANSLLLGRLVRPMADRVGVSRERLAYLADTTSSAIACLAPVSTWIAMQLGLISVVLKERQIEVSPYSIFLKSVPYNFYCLFSLVLAGVLIFMQKDFGAMRKASPVLPSFIEDGSEGSLWIPFIAVGSLLFGIPLFYYLLSVEAYLPFSIEKLTDALGSSKGPSVFMISSSLSLIFLFLLSRAIPVKKRFSLIGEGMRQMLLPLGVLVCAWLFSGVMKDLGLAKALTDFFHPQDTLKWFPCVVFLLGCLLSFMTGTSWGTMALLFPLTFNMLGEIPNEDLLLVMPILCAAIFSGSVFGDHCSPFSDTTIVSAVAAGCTPYDHVKTQLPYALSCGGLAMVAFLIVGLL